MKKPDKNKAGIFAEHAIKKTSIDGLLIIERPIFKDGRGFFKEIFRLDALEEQIGKKFHFKQANHTFSKPGVIRGLHAEGWNKIIAPLNGKVFIAIVDIRPESKNFAKIETLTVDEKNPRALYIPKGLANSFCVLGNKPVDYIYLVDAYYDGSDTTAIAWDDPDLNINWPIKNPVISERDRNNPTMREKFPGKYKKK
ncbi:dTDP-4-dehydrorhamnose 3,5-epimerase family protein [Patescibacteria group bacterium]|nr:dTDP-4-dehydrorhamnose 3,5-epimerase family protein [Patescibacteria group bacterium]MBU0776914.1 dTDP-4-dehydrorhamnose 3,5-epimerase family protein [Patescibacteria group bacterium]MBU0846291.1 dTDP-4-dehydrorhamnose 3,5-epimerase family protein [Patescibacteria group bacterium]MBU0922555.1 dTDP-4-dehydrorhamnose 3,5-epimerase family protein [Patescibacteria group bacterium]MBU1066585.1 dTDP-4-dehydrorhamnose 3,5-epimerase family protein [Patescibacteria group bacterium]